MSLLGFGREAALYVQASAAKKRRAVYLFQRLSTPGHQPSIWCRSGWLLLQRGMMRTVLAATAGAILMACFASSTSIAETRISDGVCGTDTRSALAAAKQAVHDKREDNDRIALACLIEAVAALDDRIRGLADGRMPFEGQIYAPKGVVMVKPSAKEGR